MASFINSTQHTYATATIGEVAMPLRNVYFEDALYARLYKLAQTLSELKDYKEDERVGKLIQKCIEIGLIQLETRLPKR